MNYLKNCEFCTLTLPVPPKFRVERRDRISTRNRMKETGSAAAAEVTSLHPVFDEMIQI